MSSRVNIFAGRASRYLGEQIADAYGMKLGNVHTSKFSDGEFQPSFEETVRGNELFIVQSTFAPADNLMELLMMIDAAKRASSKQVVAVIPYFGFARQDRKDKPRVAIGAKLTANLLCAAGVDRIVTMDLHADQIQGFFDIPVDHLYGSAVFIPYIRSLNLNSVAMASPDTGGTKRAAAYSKFLDCDLVICYKQRSKSTVNHVESMTLIGEVKDKDILLVDDIIDTAGTICKAGELIKEAGARTVRAICTHPVFSGNAYQNIANSVFEEVIVADTLPLKEKLDKITVLSTADLFADVIGRIHRDESISTHFKLNTIL